VLPPLTSTGCGSTSASMNAPAKTRSRSSILARRSTRGRCSPTAAVPYTRASWPWRNVLVGFMAWDGFNFEDAIIISEELVEDDVTPRSTSRNTTSRSVTRS
jgi:DNA-directed RNA polymerase beta subunit